MSQMINLHDAFLAILLSDSDTLELEEIFHKLKPEMFPSWRKTLFKILKESYEKKGTLDLALLEIPEEMESEVGRILNGYSTGVNFQSYYQGVLEFYKKERTLGILKEIESLQYEEWKDFVGKKIVSLEKILSEEEHSEYSNSGDLLSRKIMKSFFLAQGDDYSTGFLDLDKKLFLTPGDLWIIGARPSMGKTAFLLSLAKKYAVRGKRVALFSLEMGASTLVQRLYGDMAGIPIKNIVDVRNRINLTDAQREKLKSVSEKEYLRNIIFYDEPGCNLETLKFQLKQLVRREHVQIVCIDYLQYVGNSRDFSRHDLKIADTTREIKNLLRELGVVGIVLAQLNRRADERADRRPIMSDLDGSSEIEKTADIISFLYRDEYYNRDTEDKNTLEVTIAKQRNGETGLVKMKFFGDIQRIV
ncbi:MAG: replicative DNA helicase [Fusobacteriaceae bacterium]